MKWIEHGLVGGYCEHGNETSGVTGELDLGCCGHGNALSAFRKGGIIISQLTDCQLPLLQDFILSNLQRR